MEMFCNKQRCSCLLLPSGVTAAAHFCDLPTLEWEERTRSAWRSLEGTSELSSLNSGEQPRYNQQGQHLSSGCVTKHNESRDPWVWDEWWETVATKLSWWPFYLAITSLGHHHHHLRHSWGINRTLMVVVWHHRLWGKNSCPANVCVACCLWLVVSLLNVFYHIFCINNLFRYVMPPPFHLLTIPLNPRFPCALSLKPLILMRPGMPFSGSLAGHPTS